MVPHRVAVRRLAWVFREDVEIPALIGLCLLVAAAAVLTPLWLLAESHPAGVSVVHGLADACVRVASRGSLAPFGYVAGGVLALWGISVLLTFLVRIGWDLVHVSQLQRQLNAVAHEVELCVAGGPVSVWLIPGSARHAFTLGLMWPRIYMTRGLLGALDHREIEAVVLHEAAHAQRRDPLRCWLVRVAATSLWFPRTSDLASRFAAIRETRADATTISITNDERPLLTALLKAEALPRHRMVCSIRTEGLRLLRDIRVQDQEPWGRAYIGILASISVLGLLTLLTFAGLTDWQFYWACAQHVSGQRLAA